MCENLKINRSLFFLPEIYTQCSTRPIPIISIKEQKKITDYLDKEIQEIVNCIDKQKQLIEKLKEYRASVISHAVTGKIDIRELVA